MKSFLRISISSFFIMLILYVQVSFCGELHIAAVSGDTAKVKELISNGCKIDEYDSDPSSKYEFPKGTALHWAVSAGKEDVVKLLIDSGSNLNAKTDAGVSLMVETPLDYAVWGRYKKIVLMLLDAGADVKGANHDFHWPLEAAASTGAIDIMEILLNHGADIKRTGVDGYTALHSAILNNQKTSIEFLLAKGLDPNFIGPHFQGISSTALELASQFEDKEIVDLLRKYGAK